MTPRTTSIRHRLAAAIVALLAAMSLSVAGVAPPPLSLDSSAAAEPTYNPDGPEGTVYRLYRAYFLREPDQGGFDYWVSVYQQGYPLTDISENFTRSTEFRSTYGALVEPRLHHARVPERPRAHARRRGLRLLAGPDAEPWHAPRRADDQLLGLGRVQEQDLGRRAAGLLDTVGHPDRSRSVRHVLHGDQAGRDVGSPPHLRRLRRMAGDPAGEHVQLPARHRLALRHGRREPALSLWERCIRPRLHRRCGGGRLRQHPLRGVLRDAERRERLRRHPQRPRLEGRSAAGWTGDRQRLHPRAGTRDRRRFTAVRAVLVLVVRQREGLGRAAAFDPI